MIGTWIAPVTTITKIHAVEIKSGCVYHIEVGQSMHPTHQVPGSGNSFMQLEREAKGMSPGIVKDMFSLRQAPVHHPADCLARP